MKDQKKKQGKPGNSYKKERIPSNTSSKRAYPTCDEMIRESHNDISWYNRNPQLLKDASSIAYAQVLGLPMQLKDGVDTVIPGIYGLKCVPTFGVSEDASSNVNVVSRLIYAYVRHANSGSRNYEAPDYMTYLLAMSSAYAHHAEMARLYGLARIYNARNRYYVEPLIKSLGYNFDDIIKNLASLRYYINYFGVQLNSFAVPKSMTIYDRQAWLPLHVFKDSNQDKAQLYTMSYDYLYKWSGTDYDTGSALIGVPTPAYNGNAKFADLVSFGDDLISALTTNEDIGIMSGDTLKAFGSEGVRTVVAIPEDYVTVPIYDEAVLSQIHNATIVGELVQPGVISATWDLFQEGGNLVWEPKLEFGNISGDFTQLIDCGFDNPTPEYNMEATRLKAYVTPVTTSEPHYQKIDTCGTEVVTRAVVYTINGNNLSSSGIVNYDLGTQSTVTTFQSLVKSLAKLTNFDWHPIVYIQDNSNDAIIPFGEIFNYAEISRDTLNKMHNAALWSLMEVPNMGKSI